MLIAYLLNFKEDIKPKIFNFKGNGFKVIFLVESFMRPYLFSYNILYTTLKKIFNKEENNNKFIIVFSFIYSWLVRIITGVSKYIIVNSFFIAVKFNFHFFQREPSNYLMFNILPIMLQNYIFIEEKRIYKNNEKFFNFNPGKYKPGFFPMMAEYASLEKPNRFSLLAKSGVSGCSIKYLNDTQTFVGMESKEIPFHVGPLNSIFNTPNKAVGITATKTNIIPIIGSNEKGVKPEVSFDLKNNITKIVSKYSPNFIIDTDLTKSINPGKMNDARILAHLNGFNSVWSYLSLFIYTKNSTLQFTNGGLKRFVHPDKGSTIDLIAKYKKELDLSYEVKDIQKDSFFIKNEVSDFNDKETCFLCLAMLEEHAPEAFNELIKLEVMINQQCQLKNKTIAFDKTSFLSSIKDDDLL
jgi:hypothetical protein